MLIKIINKKFFFKNHTAEVTRQIILWLRKLRFAYELSVISYSAIRKTLQPWNPRKTRYPDAHPVLFPLLLTQKNIYIFLSIKELCVLQGAGGAQQVDAKKMTFLWEAAG